MENVFKKKRFNTSGIVFKDLRGAHANANRKTDDEIDIVWTHILSMPTYERHCLRRDSKKNICQLTTHLCNFIISTD